MDIVFKEPAPERLICERLLQVETEGALPSPDGRRVASVLTGNAKAAVAEAVAEEGRVRVTGRIEVNVLAQDEEGAPFAFSSYAGFTEMLPIEEAAAQMTAGAVCSVQELTVFPAEGGAYMRVSLDVAVTLTSSLPLKVFGGIAGVNDIEYKTFPFEHSRAALCGRAQLRLREELPADGVSQVISVNGSVCVRELAVSSDGAFVSGTVTVSAAVTGRDGRLSQTIRQVPFRERLEAPAAREDCFCRAELKRVYLRPLGEEFDLLSLEAELDIAIWRIEKTRLELPLDAFSPTFPFECVSEEVRVLDSMGVHTAQTTFKETLALPDPAPDMALPLFASARPVITDTEVGDGTAKLSGVLITELVYESTGGTVNIVGFETPFSMNADTGGAASVRARAECTAFAPACTERAVQMQYSVTAECELYSAITVNAAVGAEQTAPGETRSGIAVYFASGGETVFDIAKRYSLPSAYVRGSCPDIAEPFEEGQKLMLIL